MSTLDQEIDDICRELNAMPAQVPKPNGADESHEPDERITAAFDEAREDEAPAGDVIPAETGGGVATWGGLSPVHQALIESSAINVKVGDARGYRTVTDSAALSALGFTESQGRVPALLIPVYNVDGEVAVYQIRPDDPRIGKNGKPIKYERPKGSRMALDVPPTVRNQLSDPSIPLYITEGSRKADAAVSKGLCCIGLLGTYGWRGTNPKGGRTALADFDSIALNGREVTIVFDSDVQDKKEVQAALDGLRCFLERKRAKVRIGYLPPAADGSKVGLDDFFAAGNTVADLAKLVKVPKRERFTLLTSDDVLTLPDPEWLIEGVLPLGGQALLYGQPASYKSFVALDKALHVASGLPWHRHTVKQRPVVYVVGEGVAGFKLRLRAWQKQHPEAEIENAYFVFEAVNLFAKEDADQLIAQLEERRLKEPLIVFDTLARCAVGADENSAKDMGIVIANVDRLRAELGATVILVHHTRKEDLEARGSSALAGAMDTMIAAVRQDRQGALVSLKCKKQKDAAEFDMIRLVADPVPLDDGESSLVLTGEGDGVGGEDEKDDPTPEKEKVYRDVIEGQVAMLEEPVGAEELRRLTGIPSSSFYLVLPKLVADGHIVTEGKRRKRYTARPEVREAMAQLRSRTAGEATSDGALIH